MLMSGFDSSILADFSRLFMRAAANGRCESLFGADTLEKAGEAVRRGSIHDAGNAGFYFEMPFTGSPRMDLLMEYKCAALHSPVKFADGYGYGFQSFFDACAIDASLSDYACGFSFDLSEASEIPGIYLLPNLGHPNADYVPRMLSWLGGEERTARVMDAFASAPSAWRPYYAGYMKGRPGAPARLGFFIPPDSQERYALRPELLMHDLDEYSAFPVTTEEREKLLFLASQGRIWDLQFDLYPDGSFSDALGVSLGLGFGTFDPRNTSDALAGSMAETVMLELERWGMADTRWRQMFEACYAVKCVVQENGCRRLVADLVRPNTVKVRFRQGKPFVAKGYLFARSYTLEEHS